MPYDFGRYKLVFNRTHNGFMRPVMPGDTHVEIWTQGNIVVPLNQAIIAIPYGWRIHDARSFNDIFIACVSRGSDRVKIEQLTIR